MVHEVGARERRQEGTILPHVGTDHLDIEPGERLGCVGRMDDRPNALPAPDQFAN